LATHLKAREVCYIDSDALPPVMVLHNGVPKETTRIFDSNEAKILVSETPLPPALMVIVLKVALEWLKKNGVKEVFSLGGIPVENRVEIEKPEVFLISSDAKKREQIRASGLNLMEEGVLVGPFAHVMRESLRLGIANTVILGQAFQNMPDPEASVAVLETLAKIGGPKVDLTPLNQMADQIKLRSKEVLQKIREHEEGGYNLPLMYG